MHIYIKYYPKYIHIFSVYACNTKIITNIIFLIFNIFIESIMHIHVFKNLNNTFQVTFYYEILQTIALC